MDEESVSFKRLQEHFKNSLKVVLNIRKGQRDLILDPSLSPLLSTVAGLSFIKGPGGVNQVHLLEKPEPPAGSASVPTILYIVRPTTPILRLMVAQIRRQKQAGLRKQYVCIFVPRRTVTALKLLESEGLYGEITPADYPLDLVPLESDLASLQLNTSFKDWYLYRDRTVPYALAESLFNLQLEYGVITHISGIGKGAGLVKDLLIHLTKKRVKELKEAKKRQDEPLLDVDDEPGDDLASFPAENRISHVIILDRELDLVTPMMTQLTYQGLLDEVVGIESGYVLLEPWITGGAAGEPPKKHLLSEEDPLFCRIRDMACGDAMKAVSRAAKDLRDKILTEGEVRELKVPELRGYMQKVGGISQEKQSLSMHVNLAKKMGQASDNEDFLKILRLEADIIEMEDGRKCKDTLENLINRQRPLPKVLRLFSLYCSVRGGLKRSSKQGYDFFREAVLQSYGYQHIPTLLNLEQAGLISERAKVSPQVAWKQLRDKLKLVVEEAEGEKKTVTPVAQLDQALSNLYTASHYVPLTVRLVQHLLRAKGADDLSKVLHSGTMPTFDVTYHPTPESHGAFNSTPLRNLEVGHDNVDRKRDDDGISNGPSEGSSASGPALTVSGGPLQLVAAPAKTAVLVVFLGGLTYPEVAGLRILQQHLQTLSRSKQGPSSSQPSSLLLATTQLLNGDTLLNQLIEQPQK